MDYEITDICIIEEYLSNWFTYEELSQYLCISINRVSEVLDNNKRIIEQYGMKKFENIRKHKSYIYRFYNDNKEKKDLTNQDKFILEIADDIIDNKLSIRKVALKYNRGKTTIFDYIHELLPSISIEKYKKVFEVLMENKSFSTNNKKVVEQVLNCYNDLIFGLSSKEICQKQNIGRNVLQRNLDTRLKKIDLEKYKIAKKILKENQYTPLEEHAFKRKND